MKHSEGIDYFRVYCNPDREERLIKRDFGMAGIGILVELYRRIHGELGYYCQWNRVIAREFVAEHKGSRAAFEMVNACIRIGIFDKDLYAKHGILTSRRCQKQFLDARDGRAKVYLRKDYLCISISELPKNVVFLDDFGQQMKQVARRKNEAARHTIVDKTNCSENDKKSLSRLQKLFDDERLNIVCDMIIEEAFAKKMITAIKGSPWIKTPSEGRPLSWWYSPPLKGGDKRNKIDILLSGGYKKFREEPSFPQQEYTEEQLNALFDDIDNLKF